MPRTPLPQTVIKHDSPLTEWFYHALKVRGCLPVATLRCQRNE